MNKNTLYGFILGGVVFFAIASVILMSPRNMWNWLNSPLSSDNKVAKALSNSGSIVASLEKKVSQLEKELLAEKVSNKNNNQKYKKATEKLRKEINILTSKSLSGNQGLSEIVRQMEKEINYLSGKLDVTPKEALSVDELEKQRSKFQSEIATLSSLLAKTEEKLIVAARRAKEQKLHEQKLQEKIDAEFAKKQIEERVTSTAEPSSVSDGIYDTSLLLGERKLFRNQTQIYYGGKLSIDLRRIDVGNYCDVRIRSFIDEEESTTVIIKKGEPAKVKMANDDFVIHYFYSYERPIPTCVFNVYEL